MAWADVTRLWALSDRRGVGRALAEINFRGQRLWKPGGECAVPARVPGPQSPGSGSRLGARARLCAGVGSPALWGAARPWWQWRQAAAARAGAQVNGRSPSGPGSGVRAARGRRRALRRPGQGRGARPGFRHRRVRPRPGEVSAGESRGVTRRGLELSLAPQRAVSTRACPRRQISAPACSRTYCFQKSTHKYT